MTKHPANDWEFEKFWGKGAKPDRIRSPEKRLMFSKPLLGTDTDKVKLSWMEYILFSCIQQGWYNCWYSFKNWADLMGNNYTDYGILPEDDDLEWCIDNFWDSLCDEIYSKDFLEELMQMSADVESGKVKTYPLTEDFFDRLKDLVDEEED